MPVREMLVHLQTQLQAFATASGSPAGGRGGGRDNKVGILHARGKLGLVS